MEQRFYETCLWAGWDRAGAAERTGVYALLVPNPASVTREREGVTSGAF